MSRVVVTGRGVLSAIGRGVPAFSEALRAGVQGIVPVEGLPVKVAAPVAGFDSSMEFASNELAFLDRSAQFALLSAREAVAESGLDVSSGLGPRVAVIVGAASGNICSLEESYRSSLVDGRRRLPPFTVPKIMANSPASHISMAFGVTGPAFVVSTACASSAYAVGLGLQMIRSGAVDVAIVGGAEASLVDGNLKGWESLRVLAPDTCRPFSKDRRGLVLGEGAAMLVIESLAHARQRNAPVFGEIRGYALTSDAHHILSPSIDGQADAIRHCLRDAEMDADELVYINAHGTATAANDVAETRALRQALGAAVDRLQVSSTKSMHGHTLGAAGAIELLATLVGLQERFAPPTLNFVEADPECDLNCVPNEAQALGRGLCALSNSFAFGGHNAVLAVASAAAV
ncbi:beta-ketoacyl-[acyl-carrier-protein] synthase family protein [Variovorax sp. J2P1-59]|uniref:beta-ketoacyl-[acyl-carrier-protein] synthase family protein n=1 Tax=Variovorax flavidus TaxID=3053501 RepID=UPI002578FA5A|nr:beta-ketoacyl-[acyl-carrier-protein] synthase family protein [Variovorax sp. J2P1-59]MDM0077532.1 beta-ketoacyl-[acyl-carrier-protein] synthase family protein [Variovorax sp. J2P1-59]